MLTVDEVGWLRAIHDAAPDLGPGRALRFARLYMAAGKIENGAWLSHALDYMLAVKGDPTEDPASWLESPPDYIGYVVHSDGEEE